MEPSIYDVNYEKCHLFYRNYLVVNLPVERKQECLNTLRAGQQYTYPRGARRALVSLGSNNKAENNLNICTTFIWDDKSRFIIRNADYDLVFKRLDEKISLSSKGFVRKKDPLKEWFMTGSKKGLVVDQSALKDWLIKNLEARGYKLKEHKRPVYTHKDIVIAGCLFLCALVMLYIFNDQYKVSHNQTEVFKMLAAGAVALVALGYAIKKWFEVKNLTEPVYFKSKS